MLRDWPPSKAEHRVPGKGQWGSMSDMQARVRTASEPRVCPLVGHRGFLLRPDVLKPRRQGSLHSSERLLLVVRNDRQVAVLAVLPGESWLPVNGRVAPEPHPSHRWISAIPHFFQRRCGNEEKKEQLM